MVMFDDDRQRALEARAADPSVPRGTLDDWTYELGGHRLLLLPTSGDWFWWDRLHETWQPTGHRAGEVRFGVEDGALVMRAPTTTPFSAPPVALSATTRAEKRGKRSVRQLLSTVSLVLGLATTGFGGYRMLTADTAQASDPVPAPTTTTEPAPTPTTTEPPPATTTTAAPPTTTVAAPTTIECANPDQAYTVRYPSDWYTDAYDGGTPCHLFHPEPFEAEESEGGTAVAIVVDEIGVAYADWVASYEGNVVLLDRRDTTVAGLPAVVFRYHFDGEPEIETYEYVVDRNGEAFVLSAYRDRVADFAEAMAVLDEMAASFRF